MIKNTLDKAYLKARIKEDPATKCWEWQLSLNPQTGYGQIGVKPYTAHRLAYYLWVGDPEGLVIRHACHNKVCCNPKHLRAGDHRDNYYDSLPRHQAAWETMRGRPSINAKPVVIHGVAYSSIDGARKALRIGWLTAARLSESSPRTGQVF